MEKFVINGGYKLKGDIDVLGAKNAVLPILAASILVKKDVVIDNVPKIKDVLVLLDILKGLGVKVKFLNDRKVLINSNNINLKKIEYDLITKIRSSILLFSALASIFSEFKITVPGGCKLGARILDPHIESFKVLGIDLIKKDKFFHIKNNKLKKSKREIILSEMSVTATENIIIASVLMKGETTIRCAAQEPYIMDLCHFLNNLGANISGIGTNNIKIKGVKSLSGGEHFVIYDPIEMGTFIALAAGTKSNIKIKNVIPEFIKLELLKFKSANVKFKIQNLREFDRGWGYKICDLIVSPSNLKAVKKIHNMPYPGISPDILPIFSVLMTQAKGVTLVHDWMYEGRMKYIDELRRMGADAFICDPHRALITGPEELEGKEITSFDLRAGATLIIASLIAKGESIINNAYQVDRGYEDIEIRLRKVGAKIKRVRK